MYRRLENQVAIVTGGAQGLGEALAHRLDAEGCKVVVADINLAQAEKVAAVLTDAIAVKVDVSDEQQVDAMVDAAVKSTASLTF